MDRLARWPGPRVRGARLFGPYRLADVHLLSAWPLTELPAAAPVLSGAADITCELLSAPPPDPAGGVWTHCWLDRNGATSLSLARTAAGFLLCFSGLARFSVSLDGCRIGVWPAPETNTETLTHLLLDQVLPRVLAHLGRLVVHASAVRVGDRAIAFVGETGQGKSTLAASFDSSGYPLLSDDGLVINLTDAGVLALPTYQSLRLWPEAIASLFGETPRLSPMAHYSAKRRVLLENSRETAGLPVPLAALYVLAPQTDGDQELISVSKITARDACMAIISSAFRLDVTDHRQAAGLLDMASDLAIRLPAFALRFPRSYALLPEVRAAVLEHFSQ
jgi:hypothetical protein